MTISKGSMGK